MKIISVNVGRPRLVVSNEQSVSTGIYKTPVAGRVMLRKLNLDGDRQADLSVHGGPTKAAYAYPSEHYNYWHQELPGMELPWGMFGENFTTEGLDESRVNNWRPLPSWVSGGNSNRAAHALLQTRHQV